MANYIVADNRQITPSTQLITLRLTKGKPLLFQPGQYAAINGYKQGRPMPIRCFSIVSSPTETGTLQFSMRVRGRFTHAVAELRPNTPVHVQGPYGGLVYNPVEQHRVVLLAGGIGITPFMSMMRYSTDIHAGSDIHLFYSLANQDDAPFAEEILQLSRVNTHLQPTFVVAQGETHRFPHQHVASGMLDTNVVEQYAGPVFGDVTTQFYICGPPPFMNAMLKALTARGVSRSSIMTEAFSQGPNRQTGKVRDWPFGMYALTALGLSAGSFIVMGADLANIIPPEGSVNTSKQLTSSLSNNRQQDLDTLINSLPPADSSAKRSPKLRAAIAAADRQSAVTSQVASGTSSSTTSNSTTSSSTPTSTTTPTTTTATPTPAPPPPPPTCTTTQSGVTTC